nr:hypothetical protein [uncultured Campylobacter sp.]
MYSAGRYLLQKRSGKKAVFFITKLANLEIQAPATGLLVSPRKKEASEKQKSACEEKNDGEACSQIASSYNYDPKNQLYFYEKAYEYGYAQGCYEAVKYTKDPEKSCIFLIKVASTGLRIRASML